MRSAAAVTAMLLAVSACGSAAPTASPTTPSAAPCPTSIGKGWVQVKDPSGVSFRFPTATPAQSTTLEGAVTRTYVQGVCGTVAVAVLIVPTALNAKNFLVKYPARMKAQGATGITAGAITSFKVAGRAGYANEYHYSQPPGPAPTYEIREVLQLKKYFVTVSAVAVGSSALTPADIANAKAANKVLVDGLRTPTK